MRRKPVVRAIKHANNIYIRDTTNVPLSTLQHHQTLEKPRKWPQ